MRMLMIAVLGVCLLVFLGCMTTPQKMKWVGDSHIGFTTPRQCKIQAEDAYEQARPHLDKCFELRKKGRPERMNTDEEPIDYITINDGWYYIMRDCHPTPYKNYYTDHAVRVHTQTGELKEPE